MKWETGQPLKVLSKPPITREQLREYAAASGDNNPIHLDDTFAEQAGFPSVIVHGMISMAYLGDHLLYNFPPTLYQVLKFRARFRKVTFPGDVLSCEGKIKRVEKDGRCVVTLQARNQRGEIATEGEAEVQPVLPR